MKNIKMVSLVLWLCIGLISFTGCSSTNKTDTHPKMPGIVGSQAYDVILSFDKIGFKKPKTQNINDGFSWNNSFINIGGVNFHYSIVANKKHQISSATFTVIGTDNQGILEFCASIPYDKADKEKAKEFVRKNLGSSAKIQIGDAIFELINNEKNNILYICAIGFDDYVLSK